MSHVDPPVPELTFEAGYERLQQIANQLHASDVPVSELAELLDEGKGLERALTDYLDTVRARIDQIDRGEGVRAFRITTAQPTPSPTHRPVRASDVGSAAPAPQVAGTDDIPF